MSPLAMESSTQGSSSSPTTAPSAPRGLMSLPRELRDKIYEQACLEMTIFNNGSMAIPPIPISCYGRTLHPPENKTGLLLTSKQISTEVQEVIYSILSLSLSEEYLHPSQRSRIWAFLTQTRPENKALITRLALNWDDSLYDIPNHADVSSIQAQHLDIWARGCQESWARDRVHGPECDVAHAATMADLDESFPLITRMKSHILAALRVLPTLQNLQKLTLTFPTPGRSFARRAHNAPLSVLDTEGTLRLCFQEHPFFALNFDEILAAVRGLSGVRRLKLHHVEELEKLEEMAVAMGVYEVVAEYRLRAGWPVAAGDMPGGWYRDGGLGEEFTWRGKGKVRKWMRPWAGGDLVVKKVIDPYPW